MPENRDILNPKDSLEVRGDLFEEIADVKNPQDQSRLISRVFEHSLEDGLILLQSAGINSTQRIIEILSDKSIYFKHKAVYNRLWDLLMVCQHDLSKSNIVLADGIIDFIEYNKAHPIQPHQQSISPWETEESGFSDSNAVKLYQEIDTYYLGLMKERKMRLKQKQQECKATKGELMARKVMNDDILTFGSFYNTSELLEEIWRIILRKDRKGMEKCARALNQEVGQNMNREVLERYYQKVLSKNRIMIKEDMQLSSAPLTPDKRFVFMMDALYYSGLLVGEERKRVMEKCRYKPVEVTYKVRLKQAEEQLKRELIAIIKENGYDEEDVKIVFDETAKKYSIEYSHLSQTLSDPENPEFWDLKKWDMESIFGKKCTVLNNRLCRYNEFNIEYGKTISIPAGFELWSNKESDDPGFKIIDGRLCYVLIHESGNGYKAYYGDKCTDSPYAGKLIDYTFINGEFIPLIDPGLPQKNTPKVGEIIRNDVSTKIDIPETGDGNILLDYSGDGSVYFLKKERNGKTAMYSINRDHNLDKIGGDYLHVSSCKNINGQIVIRAVSDELGPAIFINGIYKGDLSINDMEVPVKEIDGVPVWAATKDGIISISSNGVIVGTYDKALDEQLTNFTVINGKGVFCINGNKLYSSSEEVLAHDNIQSVFCDSSRVFITCGIHGGTIYSKQIKKGKSLELEQAVQRKLDLLNVLYEGQEGLARIHEQNSLFLDKIKSGFQFITTIQEQTLAAILKDKPRLFMHTMAAKPDPEDFAIKMLHAIFPESDSEKSSWIKRLWESSGIGNPFGLLRNEVKEQVSHVLQENVSINGSDQKGKGVEVMTLRKASTRFIVTGAYSGFDPKTKTWSKSSLPMNCDTRGPSEQQTVSLLNIGGGGDILLPKPIDAQIIQDRIKGINASGEEFSLECVTSVNGESFVSVGEDEGLVEIIYSYNSPVIPTAVQEVSEKSLRKLERVIESIKREEMKAPLLHLPAECKAFLNTIKEYEPKEKLSAIQSFVRKVSYYDFDNKEVKQDKEGMGLDELVSKMKDRLKEIRQKKKGLKKQLANKLFAGVCIDFNIIQTAMLREAGMMAGILTGYNPRANTTKITSSDSHAISYVVWPTGNVSFQDSYQIVELDATPSGLTAKEEKLLSQMRELSIEEYEANIMEKEEELKREMEGSIQSLTDDLASIDIDTIKKLGNGVLENVLNQTSMFFLKNEHVSHIRELVSYWRYSGIIEKDIDITNLSREEKDVIKQQLDHAYQSGNKKEKPINEDPKGSGNAMMSLIIDTIRQYEKDMPKGGRKYAIENLQAIFDISQKVLDPTEYKVVTLILTYLKAKKMK